MSRVLPATFGSMFSRCQSSSESSSTAAILQTQTHTSQVIYTFTRSECKVADTGMGCDRVQHSTHGQARYEQLPVRKSYASRVHMRVSAFQLNKQCRARGIAADHA